MPLDPADLRTLPLLAFASPESFDLLTRDAVWRTSSRRAALSVENTVSADLPILVAGMVELEGGEGATLALLEAPATVMLASVLLEAPALVTAWATPRSQVLTIPGEALRQAVRADPALALAVSEELAGCCSGAIRALKNQRLRGTLARLANYLLTQHRRQGGATRIRLPSRKRVLASLLGMTPENLSRGFASLAPLGVEVDGPHVTVLRPRDLMRLAAPDAAIDNHAARDDAYPGRADRERRRLIAFEAPRP